MLFLPYILLLQVYKSVAFEKFDFIVFTFVAVRIFKMFIQLLLNDMRA